MPRKILAAGLTKRVSPAFFIIFMLTKNIFNTMIKMKGGEIN